MAEPMSFGYAVRELRLAHDLTQPELAARAKVSKGMVSMVETGARTPSALMAQRLLQALTLPRHIFFALLSVGGYAPQEIQETASMEVRAYLNSLACLQDAK
jgi:transcriptional regulator with XRE-family HTH domain